MKLGPKSYSKLARTNKRIRKGIKDVGVYKFGQYLKKKRAKQLKETYGSLLDAIKFDGSFIQFIDNPSKKIQLAAIKQNPLSIQFIDNPSEKIQLAAVKQNPLSIQFIDNPSEKIKTSVIAEYYKTSPENVQICADHVSIQHSKLASDILDIIIYDRILHDFSGDFYL